ncbi:PqqD family protein [Ancylobacter polymorphus]|uniref:PqqD family protein n=1 Tax=Ancylobacter polymorphus TaxID=223390 RepID=A0ABU0BF98_9HYPH|nr:PqqD family protein [Ancylobacter polymorphus]MDQ0304513.1 hypothetical protein [Ancylobacter polymorphus]
MQTTTYQRVTDGVYSADLGAEKMLLRAASGHYIGLNSTAARIWDLIEHPLTIDEICAALGAKFDVPADLCRAEALAFLELARERGIVITS